MNVRDYRDSLRQQLRDVAPVVGRMLRGEADLDAELVVGALESVTLLDDDTIGALDRGLRAEVLSAWRRAVEEGAPSLQMLLDDVIAPRRVAPADLDPLELADVLDEYVALAALLPVLPPTVAARHRAFLDQVEGDVWAAPDDWAPVSAGAEWLLDALDLPGDHPVVQLLRVVAAASELSGMPVDDDRAQASFEQAAAAVRRSPGRRRAPPSPRTPGPARRAAPGRFTGVLARRPRRTGAHLGGGNDLPVHEARFEVGSVPEAAWFGGVVRVEVGARGRLTVVASMSREVGGPRGSLRVRVWGDGAELLDTTLTAEDRRHVRGHLPGDLAGLELELEVDVVGEEEA